MSRKEEKELERRFVNAFLQTIGNTNILDPNDREEPDFLLNDLQLIGIEVTQLFSDPNIGEVSRVNTEGGWDGLLELALKMWIDSGKTKVDVRIMFNDTIHIRKTERLIFATELIVLIDKYLPEPGESFWSQDDMLGLPRGIVEFHIHRVLGKESPNWRFNDAAWTPELTTETVQKRIDKKEERRSVYLQNCDNIWLLLVLYGRRPSGSFIVPESVFNSKYQFEFDKVFIFNAIPKHIWELHRCLNPS